MKRKYRALLGALLFGLLLVLGAFTVHADDKMELRFDGVCEYMNARSVLDGINSERASRGLPPLLMNKQLQTNAMQRAAELLVMYSHTRPNNESFVTIAAGNHSVVDETVAILESVPSDVVELWMSKKADRETLLSSTYTAVGVGCFEHLGQRAWAVLFTDGSGSGDAPTEYRDVTAKVEVSRKNLRIAMTSASEEEEYLVQNQVGMLLPVHLNKGKKGCGVLIRTDVKGWSWNISNSAVLAKHSVTKEGCIVLAKRPGVAQVSLKYGSMTLADYDVPVGIYSSDVLYVKAISGKRLQVSWYGVADASGYLICRKSPGGDWEEIGSVPASKTYYIDTKPTAGVLYTYGVMAYVSTAEGDILSDMGAAASGAARTAAPPLQSVKATAHNRIQLTWGKVSGAKGYRIYRKTPGTDWVRQKSVSASTTAYTDTNVVPGIKYTYTVRAWCQNENQTLWGEYNSKGLTAYTRLAAPKLKSIEMKSSTRISITWDKVPGVQGYRIYRKTPGGSWTALGNVSPSTITYTDTKAKAGVRYTYTVRSWRRNGKTTVWGGYDSKGLTSYQKAAAPQLKSIRAKAYNQIQLTWGKAAGAQGYRVYRKTPGGSWTALGNVSPSVTSYTDAKAVPGIKYTYTVRSWRKNGKTTAWGGYDKKGLTGYTRLAAPKLKSVRSTGRGRVQITWNKVPGVQGYRIYRKTAGGSWTALGNVSPSATSYTDTKAKPGVAYTYTVRSWRRNGKTTAWGGYDKKGLACTARKA